MGRHFLRLTSVSRCRCFGITAMLIIVAADFCFHLLYAGAMFLYVEVADIILFCIYWYSLPAP